VARERENPVSSTLEYEIAPELLAKVNDLPGKWVAITRSDLLGVGDTADDALKDAGITEASEQVILRRVPDNRGRSYFY
jgi:hypothetical protein